MKTTNIKNRIPLCDKSDLHSNDPFFMDMAEYILTHCKSKEEISLLLSRIASIVYDGGNVLFCGQQTEEL